MFKLLSLHLSGHPQLGSLDISFVDENEIRQDKKPYSSIIIGPNGSGKSFILRVIIEIFRNIEKYQSEGYLRDEVLFQYTFQIRYIIDKDIFDIITNRIIIHNRKNGSKTLIIAYKNRPDSEPLFIGTGFPLKNEKYEIHPDELKLPQRLIASSVMLNDRFIFSNSLPNDFYQYLGVRRTTSLTSTQSFSKKTVKYLFEASTSETFLPDLSDILEFLNYQKYFTVYYRPRYRKLFFSGKLSFEEFSNFFNKWWDSGFTSRKAENPSWSKFSYDFLMSENQERLNSLIEFLNRISLDNNVLIKKNRSKLIEIDLFNLMLNPIELSFIDDLVKLDIINFDSIHIKKKENEISIEQASSGEYHFIISLLSIYSKIKENSLILIDEPEISLHPNWQMKYINFLKQIFKKYSNCHFIISTHSHFLVSDLEGNNSSVLTLSRSSDDKIISKLLTGINTYGWSAEQVLLTVFKTASSRNFYLTQELEKIFELISLKKDDKDSIHQIQKAMEQLNEIDISGLTDIDPLKDIILTINKKFKNA